MLNEKSNNTINELISFIYGTIEDRICDGYLTGKEARMVYEELGQQCCSLAYSQTMCERIDQKYLKNKNDNIIKFKIKGK